MTPHESKWERPFDAVLGVAASVILMLLMLLTTVDVISRYLFNWPLRGGFEMTELMLLILIFAGLPLVSHADEHVTMDFIDRMLGARAVAAIVRLVHALCAAVMFFLAWLIWLKAGKIAVGPFVYFMALMIGLTGLIHVFKTFVPGAARSTQATT